MVLMLTGNLFALGFNLRVGGQYGVGFVLFNQELFRLELVGNRLEFLGGQVGHRNSAFLKNEKGAHLFRTVRSLDTVLW